MDADVDTVIVDPLPELVGFGAKEADAPEGSPVAARLTLWVDPLVTCVVIEAVVVLPWVTVGLDGLAAMVK